MNLKETRAAELASANEIVTGAKDRDLTDEETATVERHVAKVKELDTQIAAADKSASLVKSLGSMGLALQASKSDELEPQAPSPGEHFVRYAGQRLKEIRGISGGSVSAPEWFGTKIATDPQTVGTAGVFQGPILTEYDHTIVRGFRPRIVVADLLSSGTITGNAISYFIEAALEGAFTTVAEGAAKPQLHVVDPTIATDALKKVAGFIKFTDEMTEDLAFYVTEVNNRLMYEMSRMEEQQLLVGNGTGTNVLGVMNRVGVQSTGLTTTLKTANPDAIFAAITSVSTATGLDADGIIINPIDYQALRLAKDANAQYYGGGFFLGTYGINGFAGAAGAGLGATSSHPPIWGLSTVVTPAIAAGTVLIGSFKQGATVYRKGGVRIESTNSHASDFTSNLVTTRAEERIALAVRYPAAFVKLTLGTA